MSSSDAESWPISTLFTGRNGEELIETPLEACRPQGAGEGGMWACKRCVYYTPDESLNCSNEHARSYCMDNNVVFMEKLDAITLKLTGPTPP